MTIVSQLDLSGATPGAEVSTFDPTYAKTGSQTGNMIAGGSGLVPALNAASRYADTTIAPVTDINVNAMVHRVNANTGDLRLFNRLNSAGTNGYCVRIFGSSIGLYVMTGGTLTQLGSIGSHGISDGGAKRVELICEGSQITCKVDGAIKVGPITETTYPSAGYMGFGAASSATQNFSMSDWLGETVVDLPADIAFTGTVPNQNATVGTPFSLDLSSYFSGGQTPFTYSTFAGTLPAGLTRTGAVISGTPTTPGTSSGIVIRGTDTGSHTANTNSFSITVNASDGTPPTLTSPMGSQTGQSTASGTVTTDESNGTLYAVISISATAPTALQVENGQFHTGAAAPFATNAAVTAIGLRAVNATGLTAATTYYWHYMHKDAAGNRSAVVSSASFTTAAATLAGFSFDVDAGVRQVFGDLAGALTGIARQTSVGIVVRAYNTSTGALVATSGTLTTDAGGRLPRWEHASLTAATTYHLLFIRQSDGEVIGDKMATT